MANQETTEGAEPRDGPFDDPPMTVRAESAPIFVPAMEVVVTIGARQHDASIGKAFAQGVAVVRPVAKQMFGIPPMRRYARVKRRVDERDFRGRRRGNGDSQRNTLTLDQYHAL